MDIARRLAPFGLGMVGIPLMFFLGYKEGESSLGDSDQVHQVLDKMFKKHENTFRKKTVIPPIRRITYPNVTILYSTSLRVPLAVYENLDQTNQNPVIIRGSGEEQEYEEESIKQELRSSAHDYKEIERLPDMSKGRMASPDNYLTQDYNRNLTFSFANTFPQNKDNRNDVWETFEIYQRDLTKRCNNVDIVSGSIFTHKDPPTEETDPYRIQDASYRVLGKSGVAVPPKLYKIIRCNKQGASYVSAFMFNNEPSKDNERTLSSFQVPISTIEVKTGITFRLPGDSLTHMDAGVLEKTKGQFDQEKIQPIMLASETFQELRDRYRALKAHKLPENDAVMATMKRVSLLRMQQIRQDSKLDDCERILEYMAVRVEAQGNRLLNEVSGKVKAAEEQSLKICINREKLERLKIKIAEYSTIFPDSAPTLKKIDEKLVELNKNRQL